MVYIATEVMFSNRESPFNDGEDKKGILEALMKAAFIQQDEFPYVLLCSKGILPRKKLPRFSWVRNLV
jgi:hypothetical protein